MYQHMHCNCFRKTSVYRNGLYIRVCNSRNKVSVSLCLVPFQRRQIVLSRKVWYLVVAYMWRKLCSYLHSYLNSPRKTLDIRAVMWDLQKMWHFGRQRPRRACAAPFMLINPNTTRPAAHQSLNIQATCKGSHQTAWMHRLVNAFAVVHTSLSETPYRGSSIIFMMQQCI